MTKPKRDTKEKVALSADASRELAAMIVQDGLAANPVGLLICLCTAVRLSEMLALTWNDFQGDVIHVSRSMVKDSQETKRTKTEDVRDDPCPAFLVDVLDDWKCEQARRFQAKGLVQSGSTPIVNSRKGTHVTASVYERWFRGCRDRYPLPAGFTIHGLRHTTTTLLQKDCDVDARTTMSITGHKTMQMLGSYSHTDAAAKRAAASKLNELIAPVGESRRCRACDFWGVSPVDASLGVCWKDAGSPSARITKGTAECTCDSVAEVLSNRKENSSMRTLARRGEKIPAHRTVQG